MPQSSSWRCFLRASTYYLGYIDRSATGGFEVSDARFRISLHDALYHSAEQGDLQKIHSSLSVALLGEVRAYEYEYGDESGTNSFAKRFADAKAIADHVESTLVPISSITNFLPTNMQFKVENKQE